MSVRYSWASTKHVVLSILTPDDGPLGEDSNSVEPDNVALEIACDEVLVIEGPDHAALLAVIERMRQLVEQHRDAFGPPPKFTTPEEADAWLERRAAARQAASLDDHPCALCGDQPLAPAHVEHSSSFDAHAYQP